MCIESSAAHAHAQPDPLLDGILRHAIGLGLVLVLLFPFARGDLPWLGWAPLWLVGMPLAAWLALHRFQWPVRRRRAVTERRRPRAQARLRRHRVVAVRGARAA